MTATRAATPTNRYNMFNACYGLQSIRTERWLSGSRAPFAATSLNAVPPLLQALQARPLPALQRGRPLPRRRPAPRRGTSPSPGPQRLGRRRCRSRGSSLTDAGQGRADGRRLGRHDQAGTPGCRLRSRSGCAEFPEVGTNVAGNPFSGVSQKQEIRGFVDAHTHGMAFEFLGGEVHCGRPWSPYGVEAALKDCPDHYGDRRQGRGDGGVPLRQDRATTRSAGRPSRTGRRPTR